MKRLRAVLLVTAAAAIGSWAQLAVKAGLIQYADDDLQLNGQLVTDTKLLAGTRVAAGQQLRTMNGRAELVLQPRNYLRLAPNTSVRMISDQLASVKAEITGVVMLDTGSDGGVELTCGQSMVTIATRGMYRLNCGAVQQLRVYRGRAEVLSGAAHRRLGGREAITLGPAGQTSKLDRKDFDESKLKPHRKMPDTDFGNRTITDSNDIGRILYGPWQL